MKIRGSRRPAVPNMPPERAAELRARIQLSDVIHLTYGRARIVIPHVTFEGTIEPEFW